MSWDVSVQRFGKEYESIADIPDTERCVELGSQVKIREAISRFFPGVDWSDTTWGIFDSDDGSVEFNMGRKEPSTGFMMYIRHPRTSCRPSSPCAVPNAGKHSIAARVCFWNGPWSPPAASKTGPRIVIM